MRQLVAILFFSSATAIFASPSFDDYQIILSRKPFGETPVVSSTSSSPASMPSAYRLSALYEGVDGEIRVGLVNKQSRKSLVLAPNAPDEGVELVAADLDDGTATISESGRIFTLELEKATASTAEPTPLNQPTASRTSRFAQRRQQLLDRMKENNTQPTETAPRLHGEELRQHLQEYQMEVIRRGLPALPIPLTEEMDRQLVEEGVLSPNE